MFVLVQPTAGGLPIVGMDAPTVAANTAATTMRIVAVCLCMVPSYSMRIVDYIRHRPLCDWHHRIVEWCFTTSRALAVTKAPMQSTCKSLRTGGRDVGPIL